VLLVSLVAGWLVALTAAAQEAGSPSAPSTLTSEAVQQQLQKLEQTGNLDEATKAQIHQLQEQAERELEETRQRAVAEESFDKATQEAPRKLEQTRRELSAVPSNLSIALPSQAKLEQLEETLAAKEAELDAAKQKLTELEAEPKRRTLRRKELPGLIGAAKERLDEAVGQLEAPAAADQAAPLAAALRIVAGVRRLAAEQEIRTYEKELKAYEVTAELLPVERDLTAAQVSLGEEEVKQWRELVNHRRQAEAKAQLDSANLEAARADPALRALAGLNRQLAEQGDEVAQKIQQVSTQLEKSTAELDDLKKRFARTREKVAIGLTNTIGQLLRSQRGALPDAEGYRRTMQARQAEIGTVQLQLFELEDQRSELADLDRRTQVVMAELGYSLNAATSAERELAVRELLERRRSQLDAVLRNLRRYLETLGDLDNIEQQLADETGEYAAYIDERVLWIRSAMPLDWSDLRDPSALRLAQPGDWAEVARLLTVDFRQSPGIWILAAAVLLPWLFLQRRLRRELIEHGELASKSTFHGLLPTLFAAMLTVLIGAVWPIVLWFFSWRLMAVADTPSFAQAVGSALRYTAVFFWPLELLRQICRRQGLAEAHFDWPSGSLAVVRREIRAFLLLAVPLIFAMELIGSLAHERWQASPGQASLGRLAFILLLLLATLFLHRALRPSGDFFRYLRANGGAGWLYRFRHLWYTLGIVVPTAFALMAAVGYYYTAHRLTVRMRETLYLPLFLMILGAILARWILVVRRRLAIEQTRTRRAAEAESSDGAEPPGLPTPVEHQPDLTAVSAQTRRLVNSLLVVTALVGVWAIWSDVLPALAMLKQVPLWQTAVESVETAADANGGTRLQMLTQLRPVTLADAICALVIVVMTLIAARNMPGLLEMAIPRRLPLDAGARYAIGTIARYVVTVVGLLPAMGMLGISWTKVQWLIAAVSVGLGFGLQEIFANFVSGLIILFERPIRVGDIITIGDVTGIVSRIQIRATTITSWDRKELIVPNKEFITGRLLNWTLSDQVNRVTITVGVAYGTDTERACQLLREIVAKQPYVMAEPAPSVTFEEFADSSLNLVLRCYLPNLDNRQMVVHQLHTAIYQRLNEEGIEISFPQRDIHIRSIAPSPTILPEGHKLLAETAGKVDANGKQR
jgi:potassium efflux system protein